MADAGEDGNQHRKHDRLQQQAEAGGVGDETGGEQQCEPGCEKSWDNPDGREDNKNKSTPTAFKASGKEQQPKVSEKSSPETAHENNKIFLISGFVLVAFALSHAFS